MTIFSRGMTFVKPYYGRFWTGQIFMVVATLAGLAFPMVTKYLIDSLLIDKDIDNIMLYISILAGTFMVMHLSNYIKTVSLGSLSHKMVRDLRQKLYEKLQKLPFSFLDNTGSGEIVSVMTNDINLFQEALSSGIVWIFTQFLALTGILVMLFRLDAQLTLIIFTVVPFMIISSTLLGKKARKTHKRVQVKLGYITSFINESIHGIDVIKSYVLRRRTVSMFQKENSKVASESIYSVKIKAVNGFIVGLLGTVFILLLIGIGGYHVLNEKITTGDLVAYMVYAEMIIGPLGMLSGLYMEIQKAFAAADRIFTFLDAEEERDTIEPYLEIARENTAPLYSEGLEIRDLSFSYGDEKILSDINIKIPGKSKTAFVGPSGAGKSTLFKLLLRFYNPDSGKILIGGKDIQMRSLEELRQHTAIVMQDTHLFDRSLRENILIGKPDAGEEEMIRAAKAANAHEFIKNLPDGYDTLIGENGARLSGGQRQRISIARAFLKDPEIILLDEATASLDSKSEKLIHQSLNKLMKNRTSLIIAHRLSTIKDADNIILINDGMVADRGDHKELFQKNDQYRELCLQQMV